MGMIERSPKLKVIALTDEQSTQADRLRAEREDCYARYTAARNQLESLYQEIAGRGKDWELSEDMHHLVITNQLRPGARGERHNDKED